MMDKFNYYIPNTFIIINKCTNEVKSFDTRKEFVNFLKEKIDMNKINLNKFSKDINLLTKEDLLFKYLPEWSLRRN